MRLRNNRAMTLVEITLAVSFLALTFIPIMGLLSSNLKITERDKTNIIAMNLCQQKLDAALSLKFNAFDKFVNNGKNNQGETIFNTTIKDSAGTTLDLTDYSSYEGDVVYHFELTVSDRPGIFRVRQRELSDLDPNSLLDDSNTTGEEKYQFSKKKDIPYSGLVHRYKMRVWWQDKASKTTSGPGSIVKDYSLITFKANLESEA